MRINTDDISHIAITSRELPFGKRYRTYEWVGESSLAYLYIDSDELRPEFPWPTKILIRDDLSMKELIVRVDKLHWLTWLWYAARIKLYQPYRWLKIHLILTAYVWGLAHIEEGMEIDWYCMGTRRKT